MKKFGLVVLGLSMLLLFGTGLYYFLTALFFDTAVPLIIRVGITGIILGFIILMVSLIKERMEEAKDDISEYE